MSWGGLHRALIGVLAASVLVLAAGISALPAQAFHPEQVARGAALWKRECARCHGDAEATQKKGSTVYGEFPNNTQWTFGNDVYRAFHNHDAGVYSVNSVSEQDMLDVTVFLLENSGLEWGGEEWNDEPITEEDTLQFDLRTPR